ncbi:hypothetical protein M427DRAFT_123868 [Gonapodya prolifera JEL478]|uniref:DUF803-domain-containing protein n=1 Tax=Gonapodya prolifera (strain JEL478) TaxID=1344416 RepID=A0A139AEF0_GONPJ|nr:hypothetical protein M427DRAFT_123868 [Gonapodya prolifera JEL478]|eukprot:KXS15171.1 hypothetical protein M427DRAFT_123868 [Gonapodya prolifera JEL478]
MHGPRSPALWLLLAFLAASAASAQSVSCRADQDCFALNANVKGDAANRPGSFLCQSGICKFAVKANNICSRPSDCAAYVYYQRQLAAGVSLNSPRTFPPEVTNATAYLNSLCSPAYCDSTTCDVSLEFIGPSTPGSNYACCGGIETGLTCSVLIYENDPCENHASCQLVAELGESQCRDVNYHDSIWIGVVITLCGATITNLGLNLQKYALRKRLEKREEVEMAERRSSRAWSEHDGGAAARSHHFWHGPGGVLRTIRSKLDERRHKSATSPTPPEDVPTTPSSPAPAYNVADERPVPVEEDAAQDGMERVKQIVDHAIAAVEEADAAAGSGSAATSSETVGEPQSAPAPESAAVDHAAGISPETAPAETDTVVARLPSVPLSPSASAATLPAIETRMTSNLSVAGPPSPNRYSPKRGSLRNPLPSALKRYSSSAESLSASVGEQSSRAPPSPTRTTITLPDGQVVEAGVLVTRNRFASADAGIPQHGSIELRRSIERIRDADARPRKSVDFVIEGRSGCADDDEPSEPDPVVDGQPVVVSRTSSAPIRGHTKSVSMSAPAYPLQPPVGLGVGKTSSRFVEVPGVGTLEYIVERPHLPMSRPATDPNLGRLHGSASGPHIIHRARSTPQSLWRSAGQELYDVSVDLPDGGRLRISISEDRRPNGLRADLTKEEAEQVEAKRLVSTLDIKDLAKNPIWLIGLIVFIFANVLNFIALKFAPQSLTAPLGAISLVTNVIVAPLLNKERFTWRDIVGVALIVAGAVLVVVFAGQTYGDYPLCVLLALFSNPGTIALLSVIGAGIVFLYLFIKVVEANIEGHCTIPEDIGSIIDEPTEMRAVGSSPQQDPELSAGVMYNRNGVEAVVWFWKGMFNRRSGGEETSSAMPVAEGAGEDNNVRGTEEGLGTPKSITDAKPDSTSSRPLQAFSTSSSAELMVTESGAATGPHTRGISTTSQVPSRAGGKVTLRRRLRRVRRWWTNLRLVPRLKHDLPMDHISVRLFLPFAYASLGGLMGTLTVLFAKSTIYLLTLSLFNHYNQYNNFFAWFITLVTVITAVSQVYWINMGLQRYDALLQIPVYFTVWTLFDVVGGGIYFSEFNNFTPSKAVGFTFGVCVIFSGVGVLTDRLKRIQEADDKLERARKEGLGD